jgi:hypothetical protein
MLAVAYLVVGQPMFSDTDETANLSVGFLLVFAFIRSFLVISLIFVIVSFAVRYWSHASRIDRNLAAASYDIYLVHYFIVVGLQMALLKWTGGPVPVKVTIISFGALALSVAISRWVLVRHSRAFVVAILALFVFCLAVRP